MTWTRTSSLSRTGTGTTSCCIAVSGSPWRSRRTTQAYMFFGTWPSGGISPISYRSFTAAGRARAGGPPALPAAARPGAPPARRPALGATLTEEIRGLQGDALAPCDAQQLVLAAGGNRAAPYPAAHCGLPDPPELGDPLLRAEAADHLLDRYPA